MEDMSGAASAGSTPWELIRELMRRESSAGWNRLYALYGEGILRMGLRHGLMPEEARDALQSTMAEVARDFERNSLDPRAEAGSFRSWLMQKARWRIADELKKRCRLQHVAAPGPGSDGPRTDPLHRVADPSGAVLDRQWDAEWEREAIGLAMEELKERIDLKHWQIFHQHVVKERPALEVAKTFNTTRSQVYLVKMRVKPVLRRILERLRAKK